MGIASVPHSVVNGMKNLLAIAAVTDITFKEAEMIKEYLADPSKFAAAAAPAAGDAAPAAAAAAAAPAKEESEDEDSDDMGMGLLTKSKIVVVPKVKLHICLYILFEESI